MKKTDIKIEMTDSKKPRMYFKQSIKAFGSLGKEIKISPKSHVTMNSKGYGVNYYVDTVSICIGIGKDHTAELVMDIDAWKALQEGEKVNITTVKEFEENLL